MQVYCSSIIYFCITIYIRTVFGLSVYTQFFFSSYKKIFRIKIILTFANYCDEYHHMLQ